MHFKRDDMIKIASQPEIGAVRVKRSDDGFVYYEHPTYERANCFASYCTFVANPEIISLLQAGKKIDAIKAYRVVTGFGLKEAKNAVEALGVLVPKFGPGDVVRNSHCERTIKNVKTDSYLEETGRIAYDHSGGWDYESSLTLVRRANAVAAAPAAPTPKFKGGDRVATKYKPDVVGVIRCLRHPGFWSVDFSPSRYGICVETESNLFLVQSTPTIVIRHDTGKGYRPNDKPMVHSTAAEATKEAERLAKANPGVRFDTFSLATQSTATRPVAGTVSTVAARA